MTHVETFKQRKCVFSLLSHIYNCIQRLLTSRLLTRVCGWFQSWSVAPVNQFKTSVAEIISGPVLKRACACGFFLKVHGCRMGRVCVFVPAC